MLYFGYLIYILPGLLLAMYAQSTISSNYRKYSQVDNGTGLNGKEIAERILNKRGMNDVQIEQIPGKLTDHYDPSSKVLRLSEGVYRSTSVAAAGIAAHEVGHAIQHQEGYMYLRLRSILVPAASIGSHLSYFLIAIGMFFQNYLIDLGIALFAIVVLFQLITLPVEYNASNRAKHELESGLISPIKMEGIEKVLSAAALTYVASLLTALGTLLRLLAITGGSRRSD